jgi:hypothetical protein
MYLQGADPDFAARRQQFERITGAERDPAQGTSDDRAMTGDGEGAIDGEP